jgi:hypothetical protein
MAFAVDAQDAQRMLLVLTNAEQRVLETRDAGATWRSLGPGLTPERTRNIFGAPGAWWAGLNTGGLMLYDEKSAKWVKAGTLAPPAKTVTAAARAKKAAPAAPPRPFAYVVNDLAFAPGLWLAATQQGLAVSRDSGVKWTEVSATDSKGPALSAQLSSDAKSWTVLTARGILQSADAGASWSRIDLPVPAEQVTRVHASSDGSLALVTRWGLFLRSAARAEWRQAVLPDIRIESLAVLGETLLVSTETRGLFASQNGGKTWTAVDSPAAVKFPFLYGAADHQSFVAASATESLHIVGLRSLRAAIDATAAAGKRPPAPAQQARASQKEQ